MEISGDRVQQHSPAPVNTEIAGRTAESVEAHGSSAAATEHRLRELAREWDVERALFAVTSINLMLGLSAVAANRRWLPWPFLVAGFQLQHALQGWCPPVSVLRRMGIRTRQEIETERVALKAVRGDFARSTGTELTPSQALIAAAR